MTTITAERLALLQAHLGITDNSEDAYLSHLMGAADAYCLAQTGAASLADEPTADHAAFLLAAHWYLNREAVTLGAQPAAIPFGVEALLEPVRVKHYQPVTGYVPE